jgi:tetratricopeptide (TPR) repeat protein
VAGDPKLYDPATEKVRLTRGRELHLTISLKGNDEIAMKTSAGNMVSASESDQKVPASAKKEYEKGLRLINSGKPQPAIEHLNRAIAIYPDYHKARNDLGVQLLKLKRLEEAAEQFHAAIERSPKYFNPRLNLGLVLIEWKKYSEAMEEFRQAISIDSSRPAAHLWLGIALLETSDMASAERELLKALLLGGSAYSVAHYYMAHIHMRRGDNGEAVRELRAYLVESPAGEQAPHARLLLQRLAPGK